MCAKSLQSCPTLCDPLDCTFQAPLYVGFSRQEHRSRLLCPPPGDLPHSGIKPSSPVVPALQADSLPLRHRGSPSINGTNHHFHQHHYHYLREAINDCCYNSFAFAHSQDGGLAPSSHGLLESGTWFKCQAWGFLFSKSRSKNSLIRLQLLIFLDLVSCIMQ